MAALNATRERSRGSQASPISPAVLQPPGEDERAPESHLGGEQWWSAAWLDKDPPRAHLFRSLHAQYLPNYFVRRLVGVPSDTSGVNSGISAKRGGDAAVPATSSSPQAGESAVGWLSGLRRRCNMRGTRPVGEVRPPPRQTARSSAEYFFPAFFCFAYRVLFLWVYRRTFLLRLP